MKTPFGELFVCTRHLKWDSVLSTDGHVSGPKEVPPHFGRVLGTLITPHPRGLLLLCLFLSPLTDGEFNECRHFVSIWCTLSSGITGRSIFSSDLQINRQSPGIIRSEVCSTCSAPAKISLVILLNTRSRNSCANRSMIR